MNGLAILSVRVLALFIVVSGLAGSLGWITRSLSDAVLTLVICSGLGALLFVFSVQIGRLISPNDSEDDISRGVETTTEFAFTVIGLYLICTALLNFANSLPGWIVAIRSPTPTDDYTPELGMFFLLTGLRLGLGLFAVLGARGLGNLLCRLRGRNAQ